MTRSSRRSLRTLCVVAACALCSCGDGAEITQGVAPTRSADASDASTSANLATTAGGQENRAPIIHFVSFEPAEPSVVDLVRVELHASDPDGDEIFLRYAWTLGGRSIGRDAKAVSLAGGARGELLEVSVTASDGRAESRPAATSVELANAAPRLLTLAIEPKGPIRAGDEITAVPEARDADGDSIEFRYEWKVNDRPVSQRGRSLSARRLRRGDTVQVTVVASDGSSDSGPLSSPALEIANSPPRIVSAPGAPGANGAYRYDVLAEDPDGEMDLEFSLDGAPRGMVIDPAEGSLTWTPAADQAGTHVVSVIVRDGSGGRAVQDVEVTVGTREAAVPAAAAR